MSSLAWWCCCFWWCCLEFKDLIVARACVVCNQKSQLIRCSAFFLRYRELCEQAQKIHLSHEQNAYFIFELEHIKTSGLFSSCCFWCCTTVGVVVVVVVVDFKLLTKDSLNRCQSNWFDVALGCVPMYPIFRHFTALYTSMSFTSTLLNNSYK